MLVSTKIKILERFWINKVADIGFFYFQLLYFDGSSQPTFIHSYFYSGIKQMPIIIDDQVVHFFTQ